MTREEAAVIARIEQTRRRQERIEQLAELVADGATISAAATAMGTGQSTALAYWAEIKRGVEC